MMHVMRAGREQKRSDKSSKGAALYQAAYTAVSFPHYMMGIAQPVFFSGRYSNAGRAARENLVTAIATPASMSAFSLTMAFD